GHHAPVIRVDGIADKALVVLITQRERRLDAQYHALQPRVRRLGGVVWRAARNVNAGGLPGDHRTRQERSGIGEVDQARRISIEVVERVVNAPLRVTPPEPDDRIAPGVRRQLRGYRDLEPECPVVKVVEEADDLIGPVVETTLDRQVVLRSQAGPYVIEVVRVIDELKVAVREWSPVQVCRPDRYLD